MKRFLDVFFTTLLSALCVVFLVGILTIAFAEGETAAYVLCAPDSEVTVRTSPKSSAARVGAMTLGEGVSYDAVEEDAQGRRWAHCVGLSFEASDGWVCMDYLTEDAVEVSGWDAVVASDGRVAARAKARKKAKVRCWLHDGDAVEVFAVAGAWAVTDRGYVMTEFLKAVE